MAYAYCRNSLCGHPFDEPSPSETIRGEYNDCPACGEIGPTFDVEWHRIYVLTDILERLDKAEQELAETRKYIAETWSTQNAND